MLCCVQREARQDQNRFKGVEEGPEYLQMVLNVLISARVTQGAPEQQLEPPVLQNVAPSLPVNRW